jgi:uncharacterized RDD family membrane protein YckC
MPRAPSPSSLSGVKEIHAIPAPIWQRAAAWAVDFGLLVGVLSVLVLFGGLVTGKLSTPSSGLSGLDWWMVWAKNLEPVLIVVGVLGLLLATAYSVIGAYLWEGQTIGRKMFGLTLVDGSGYSPSQTRAVTRAILSLFSFFAFMAGFWFALFDRRCQTLHDKATGTFVVKM